MNENLDIRTLCCKCRADYENTNKYYLSRADDQVNMSKCDFCSTRQGYNYILFPKRRKPNLTESIKRGDIYYATLDPVVGSEQGGTRPVLILQNDTGNKFSPTIIVAAITGRQKKNLPTHVTVNIPALPKDSIVLLEQIRTIDKRRLSEYVTSLSSSQMKSTEQAIDVSLGMTFSEGLK